MGLTEAHLRMAVGIGLWTLSGSIMATLFLSVAGSEPLFRGLGVGWSVLLTASMLLLWRSGGWRRSITLLLEVITICAAAGMAWNRIEEAQATTNEKALETVRRSVEYKSATFAYDHAEDLVSTLTARLRALPFDWTTSAGKITTELTLAQETANARASDVAHLESTARSSNGVKGFGGLIGQNSAEVLELGLVILLATLTEVSALALVGVAPRPKDVASNIVGVAAADVTEITADTYLATARTLGDGLRLAGYRAVANRLQIGERRARELLRLLILEGRVKGRTKAGGQS